MADTENISLGRGDLLFREKGKSGYAYIGNTPSFGVTVNTEMLKHMNSSRGIRVQDREIPVQTDYSASFVTDNVTHENLARMFQGDSATVTVAAAPAQTQTFTAVAKQDRLRLAQRKVANVVVKIGAATKVLGTDYTVDLDRGMVVILDSGTIVAGANVIVEYDIVGHSYKRSRSGANVVEGSLMFVAYNPEGENIDYLLDDVKLVPNGEFQIKAEEWQQLPFNVAISTPAGGYAITANGEPFTV